LAAPSASRILGAIGAVLSLAKFTWAGPLLT
jgi:hypothetical protein